jgi:hypothetical protein
MKGILESICEHHIKLEIDILFLSYNTLVSNEL